MRKLLLEFAATARNHDSLRKMFTIQKTAGSRNVLHYG